MQLLRNFTGVSSCICNNSLNACIGFCGQAALQQLGCIEAVSFKGFHYRLDSSGKAIHNDNEQLQVVFLLFKLSNAVVKLLQQCLCLIQLHQCIIHLQSHTQCVNGVFSKLHFTLDFRDLFLCLLEHHQ